MTPDDDAGAPQLERATQGFRATLLSQSLRVACKAISVVALARLVPPSEHGLFAMAASVFSLLVLFRDLGLGGAALQARELSEEQRTTLWHAHACLGVLLAVAALAVSPLIAKFFHEPRVAILLATMSVGLVLLGFNAWPRVLLARELRFAELNQLETSAAITGTAAMVLAAVLGADAYSFVIFLLVSEGVTLVLGWRLSRWRPRAAAQWKSLRRLWRVAADLTGHNLLHSFLLQIDTLLMGRWFGASAAGFYNRPSQLLALPTQHIGWPLTQVMLATLARSERDSPDFVAQVRATANLIAHLTLPLAVVCAALPHEVVRLLLGSAWPEAAPLLRWLALGAATSYLSATVYGLCVATQHTRRLATMAAVTLAVMLLALWLGRAHGATGLAAGVALTNLALLVPRLWWATRNTPVRLRDYAAAFACPVALSAVFGTGCLGGALAARDLTWPARLAAGLVGGGTAAVGLALFWPRLRDEVKDVWRHRPFARGLTTLSPAEETTSPPV